MLLKLLVLPLKSLLHRLMQLMLMLLRLLVLLLLLRLLLLLLKLFLLLLLLLLLEVVTYEGGGGSELEPSTPLAIPSVPGVTAAASVLPAPPPPSPPSAAANRAVRKDETNLVVSCRLLAVDVLPLALSPPGCCGGRALTMGLPSRSVNPTVRISWENYGGVCVESEGAGVEGAWGEVRRWLMMVGWFTLSRKAEVHIEGNEPPSGKKMRVKIQTHEERQTIAPS